MTGLSHVKPYDTAVADVCGSLGIGCKGSITICRDRGTAAASSNFGAGIIGKHGLVDDHGASSVVNNATD